MIGVYFGIGKPKESNAFLRPFVNEMLKLELGFFFAGRNIPIKIRVLSVDLPARSYICGTKQFNGYHSCPKCEVIGEFYNNRMTFLNLDAPKRTDIAFFNQTDTNYHHFKSILTELNIGMVSQIPFDYLHMVCLGAVKKYINSLFGEKSLCKRIRSLKDHVSELLIKLSKAQPDEFQRKIRSLDKLSDFKGSEFRVFVKYSGPFVLKKVLPINIYQNFLKLHIGIFILSDSEYCIKYNNIAKIALYEFVKEYATIFGKENVVANIHGLCHLADDVIKFGPLDNFSAFAFESFFSKVNKFVTGQKHPVQQLANRLTEFNYALSIESVKRDRIKLGIELSQPIKDHDNTFFRCHIDNKLFSGKENNRYVLTKDKKIFSILSFFKKDNFVYANVKEIKNKFDFYTLPLKSSYLNIFNCNYVLESSIPVNVEEFDRKLFKMYSPEKNEAVFFPLNRLVV